MKHYTDKEIIDALRAGNGYTSYAAQRLDCPEGIIKDRIRESPEVARVYWAIYRRKKAQQPKWWPAWRRATAWRRKSTNR